jgi:hypothetical protein
MSVPGLTFKFTSVHIHSLDIIEGVNFLPAGVFLNILDKEYASSKIYNLNHKCGIDNNTTVV